MFDEETPKPTPGYRLGDNLEKFSVGDLEELIRDLRTEIERAEADLKRKRGGLSAAESLFKS